MAKSKLSDTYSLAPATRRLTPPGVFLVRMLVFLTLVGFIAAILADQLKTSLMTNPGLNGLIIGVLVIGILYVFRQVMRLYPEIRWVNAFRISDPGLAISHKPVLLAPMATMLRDRTGTLSLSTASMSSIMDSIGSRLDEARDTGKYLVGLLVFLGLLGTFWGLLETIQSVGKAIDTLDTKASDNIQLFGDLKAGLSAPLKGMGTAFSSSLLGLAGSLVLGFLELQASHAHSRFYNELEEWLSGITELTPGSSGGYGDQATRQLTGAIIDLQRVVDEFSKRLDEQELPAPRVLSGNQPQSQAQSQEHLRELAQGVSQLVTQMRTEQKVIREWVDEQAAQQTDVANLIKSLADNLQRRS